MKLFAESLMSELEHQLKLIHLETENQVQLAEQAITNSVAALEKLKTFFLKYKPLNKKEEIEFFRDIKPKFAARIIYYNEIYSIETNKPFGSQKTMGKYYKAELNKLKVFFEKNQEFYRYYRTANNCLDNKYFIREKYDLKLMVDSFYFQADHRFTTSRDYKVALILANDEIKKFLEEQIEKLGCKTITIQSPSLLSKGPKWTGSKVELIELIYALHTEGVFNNGTSGLKEVTTFFETAFNIHLGQFNRVFLEIRNRKSERTKFLNTLKNKLMIRMDEADEN
ncbi:MAG: RteC domain-containing protein [Flavobacterium sp.]|uniref:RteC domain-containing protein n=1 Tax=Flavobacterium sp. TaxID=239 RepID=UPI0027369A6B|nr:RteC domain-containing protein [Flavobacterium sp.]MDP3680045.1 RteC domain-containing protein [Flavobacterium sp.]MDZ4330354.1 RteC domain-containing protein [Flavobacterium sp.]